MYIPPIALQRLTMAGIEAHIESPLQQIRHVGMAVGEFLMNRFNPLDQSQSLKFEYETSEEIKVLQNLSRPISEQQKDLECGGRREVVTDVEGDRGEKSEVCEERFGEGMVKTVQCSDSDRCVCVCVCGGGGVGKVSLINPLPL